MFKRVLPVVALVALGACSQAPQSPGHVSAPAVLGSSAGSVTRFSAGHTFATLPDRGNLVAYPATRVVRRDGAYTWHRADLSEAHAIAAITTGRLHITSPSGEPLAFRYERHVEHPTGDWSWVGRLENGARSDEVVLTFGEQAAFGTIAQPRGKAPLKLTIQNGVSWLVETDPARVAQISNHATRPHEDDYLVSPKLANRTLGRTGGPVAAAAASMQASTSTSTTIDLVLGYTSGFAGALGGESQAVTRLNNMVTITNQALSNAQVAAQVRLVHTLQVSYPDNTDNGDTLEKLTGYKSGTGQISPDPAFAALRSARDKYGADLVSLVRKFNEPENSGCGIAWMIGGGQSGFHSSDEYFGYSVVSDGRDAGSDGKTYFCREETLAHELGHNMGSQHDRKSATEDGKLKYGVHPYSFGHKTDSATGNFYTVMAYGDSGQTSYRIFSNPRSTYCGGLPCGVADQADNARSLGQTAPIVASFRATQVAEQPPASSSRVRNDLNGDGRSDILWRNASNSSFMYWHVDGTRVVSTGSGQIGSQWRVEQTADVSGDGRTDILWSNGSQLVISLGEAGGFNTVAFQAHPAGWRLVGSGDINGDGRSDLVWRNAQNTAFAYWLLDGANVLASGSGQIGSQWRVAYVADLTGDARADIVWSNGGHLVLSVSEGTGFNTISFGTHPSGYRLVGSGDIDANGRADLVWRNAANTAFMYWLMDGTRVLQSSTGQIGSQWQVVQVDDMTGDGRADIVWSNGNQLITSISEGTGFNTVVFQSHPVGWRVATTSAIRTPARRDINGDGKSDLVWRNAENTAFAYWLLDGTQLLASSSGLIGSQWNVDHVGDVTGDGRADIVWSNGSQLVTSISEGDGFNTVNFRSQPAGWRIVAGRR